MPAAIAVTVPDGVSGDWRVETFTVSEQEANISQLRSIFSPGSYVPEGTYKRLMRGGTVVMSNTPMELDTHAPILLNAKGRVLLAGLGLGMVLTALLEPPLYKDMPTVTEVWVIEQSEDVIALVAPTFANDPRVHIIHDDIFTWQPPKDLRFDAAWYDIWDTICADNLPDMIKLHRKFGRRADWQGSWARHQCEQGR